MTPPLCFDYKHVDGKPILLDVYLPDVNDLLPVERPTIIYFHAGTLTVGNKQGLFPTWLHKRLSNRGVILVSADYRLMPPSTGHDMVEDIQDLFRFVATSLNDCLDETFSNEAALPTARSAYRVDTEAIGVSGTSAGPLCAYLACMHANPKPKVVLSMYGRGGDLLTPRYFMPKSGPIRPGMKMLDPEQFEEYLYPRSSRLELISDSPYADYPPDHDTPGYPSNPRMLVGKLYLQLGTFLDYYTGQHEPSLSEHLRSLSNPAAGVPEQHRRLFPQLAVSPAWPPTCLVHGTSDTSVLIEESRRLHSLLKAANVDAVLWEVPGAEHAFDYAPPVEGVPYDKLFDDIVEFLTSHLIPST